MNKGCLKKVALVHTLFGDLYFRQFYIIPGLLFVIPEHY
jgi:hypothetical protein